MRILNEKNADFISNGIAIFADEVNIDEDLLVESSCFFAAGVTTTGSLKAQYDIYAFDDIKSNSLIVNGKCTCLKDINSEIIDIGNELVTLGQVQCNSIILGKSAQLGSLFCKNLMANSDLFIRDSLDIQHDAQVIGKIICLDGIQVDGSLLSKLLIADGYIEIGTNQSNTSIFIPNLNQQPTIDNSDKKEPISIGSASPFDIFDYQSNLVTIFEDVSVFLDRLPSYFIASENNHKLKDELDLLKAFASYLPDFNALSLRIDNIQQVELHRIDNWYDNYSLLVDSLIMLPEYFEKSLIYDLIIDKIKIHLSAFLENNITTKSVYQWTSAVYYCQKLRDLSFNIDFIDLIDKVTKKMFLGIGIKDTVVNLYLPEA